MEGVDMMPDQTTPGVVLVGFLSNCDESILSCQLGNGFVTETLEFREGLELLKELNGSTNDFEFFNKYVGMGIFTDSSKPFYVISKTINPGITVGTPISIDEIQKFHHHSFELHNEWVAYVHHKLRLMRLFREGNIVSPLQVIYIDQKKPIRLSTGFSLNNVEREEYHLDECEIGILSEFIRETVLPFKDQSLNLALASFENTYDLNHLGLALVSCVMGLECLLSDGGSGKSYKLARNLAILLGKDGDSSRNIYERVRELYGKRSKIVHEGYNRITPEDVKEGRNLVRESIKHYLRAGLPKTELLSKLNTMGYSEDRRW